MKKENGDIKRRILAGTAGALIAASVAFSGSVTGGKWNGTIAGIALKSDDRGLTAQEYSIANLTATDDLGRTVTVMDPSGSDTKYLGVFYFAWLGTSYMADIYDVDKLEQLDPNPFYEDCAESPAGQYHFTSEPLYGYYSMTDEWVITRHIELLTMAGVDYIAFDVTNRVTYDNVVKKYLDISEKFLAEGWDVPKVTFYTNTSSKTTVKHIYETFYESGDYDNMWFRFEEDERPVIIGISENNTSSDQTLTDNFVFKSDELYKYYNWYESQWPTAADDQEHGFPWMQWGTPYAFVNGNASVSVAQHSWESVYFSDMKPSSSRGYNGETVEENWEEGQNFQYHWDAVTTGENSENLRNIFVTGWNEWIAIKFHVGDTYKMVDNFDAEYSRDIEPGKVTGDNFYMQLVENGRLYQMTQAIKYKIALHSIKDISDIGAWDSVTEEYADFEGDAIPRDGENAANVPHSYVDNSNRNDIVTIKVAHDLSNIYFYIETSEDITEYNGTDTNWMNIFISTGASGESFSGFNYVINRSPDGNGSTSVEKCTDSENVTWEKSGSAEYYVSGNVMTVKVPKSAIGLGALDSSFSFKVTDNVQNETDINDYYVTGDSAPIGRFGYAYNG